ncbi:T9SS type A sorting domain-containing protein [candidate division KSB1 bacterium]|nr:T9SS type A sorting domain-containing protein [candidate division KSB1 bacterium]
MKKSASIKMIATVIAILPVVLYAQWNLETVDTTGTVGVKCAITTDINGNPHISYRDGTIGWRLKYAHWDGSLWQIASVETTVSVYGVTSIALDTAENPHIAFDKGLWYGDQFWHAWWDGTNWLQEGVDSLVWSGTVGQWNSIVMDGDGYPHFAYTGYTYTGDCYLRYAYKDASGWHTQGADTLLGGEFEYCSIALDDSNYPHLSYYDDSEFDLKYAYWDGSTWHIERVDTDGAVGQFSSIALDSLGYPHIAYKDYFGTSRAKYAYWDGSTWQIEIVDSEPWVGNYTSLALDTNDRPHISYDGNGPLKYAYWDGSTWQTEVVDNTVSCGWTSVAIDDSGYSHIAYYDADLGDLKYAKKSPTAAYSGPIWYVSITGSDETGDGSESNPFATIQYAINSATNRDTVLVSPGTYIENINFNGKNIIVGSLTLTTGDTSYISQTVIDGDSSGTVVMFENGEDSTAVLSGFMITNGSASSGGGIYCYESNPSMVNVTITGNMAYNGGGINCTNSSIIQVNVIISENTASGWGGGIFLDNSSPTLVNVTVSENMASNGGGIHCQNHSCPSLENVTVSGNTTVGCGGGISCGHYSNPNLADVTVSGNTATSNGGGIHCHDNSNPSLENVTVSGNTATVGGGGIDCNISSPSLVNVTITGNTADWGGGIACQDNSSPSLVNTILWNGYPQEIYFADCGDPNSVTIAYSDVQGGQDSIVTNDNGTVYWLDGNIDADPLFVDPENGDFHLQEGSPCIDAGTAFFVWEGDILVNLSPDEYVGSAPDIGAYEYGMVSIDENIVLVPTQFSLSPNYPNPFNPITTIKYGLPKESEVTLKIFNILGREVATLVAQHQPAGYHQINWDATDYSSGIYFCQIQAGEFVKVRKMILLK